MSWCRSAAAALAAALVLACGVKSPPRPPLTEGARPPAAPASPSPALSPVPGTPPQQAQPPAGALTPAPDGGPCCTDVPPTSP